MATFDYVIVGGGSAGSVLANRLSEDPNVTVCLLEAGGDGKSILIRMPLAVVGLLPGKPFKLHNWAFETVPQKGLNGRRGYQPRGKALGGSSAINAQLYIRGHASDYDQWAEQGCKGWGWKDVLPYFKKSEANENGGDEVHGDSGPLHVSNQKAPRPISEAFVEAATQLQYRKVDDFNAGDNEGVGLFQVTQFHSKEKNGERCSSAAAYLHPVMDRPNLTVLTGAHATRVLLTGKRATGVEYKSNGTLKTVEAKKEVLLCGGAFNSPQLLQLSGIGRPEDITPHGIEMRHELNGVGQNLQDHLDFIHAFESKDRDNMGIGILPGLFALKHILKWRKDGVSMAATPYAEGAAFLKTDPSLERPDIQLHFVISIVDDHARKLHWGNGFSCHICQLRPYSRGSVSLESADPLAPPRIDPNYLDDERDMEVMIKGAKMTRDILMAEPLKRFRHKELFGVDDQTTDKQYADHIRQRSDTIYHPVGTCKMGTGKDAVVDPKLKVKGIKGLRVVDASIMPTLIGGNTNAPTMMIAEKAADMIRSENR